MKKLICVRFGSLPRVMRLAKLIMDEQDLTYDETIRRLAELFSDNLFGPPSLGCRKYFLEYPDGDGWYHVGVETESEARGLVGKKRQGETIMGAKHVRNVEHVKAHELRPVPIGNYWGPLIPE